MTKNFKTLNKAIGIGEQDVIYKETADLICNGKTVEKVRIEIRSDSYDKQCHARVSVFDGKKWNQVDSIHYSNMKTVSKLAYKPNPPKESDFKADREALVALAMDVLY